MTILLHAVEADDDKVCAFYWAWNKALHIHLVLWPQNHSLCVIWG